MRGTTYDTAVHSRGTSATVIVKVNLDTLTNNFMQNIICSEPSDLIIFKIVCYLRISREILNRDRGSGGLWQI